MRNSERTRRSKRLAKAAMIATSIAASSGIAAPTPARAQSAPQGFASERLYPSAPGGGWIVMDDLAMSGGLGGAASFTAGYARDPVRVASADGTQRFALVSDQAFAAVAVAMTWKSLRLHASFTSPLAITGDGGTVGRYTLTAPSLDLGSAPDTLMDVRLGAEMRLYGDARSPLRVGAGLDVYVPSGDRALFETDGTYRAMARLLAAGTLGSFEYAAQVGVHMRPLDDSPAPGSPQGSELLFGVAGGPRFLLGDDARAAIVVGPEIFGETAFQSMFGTTTTGVEALFTGRLESTAVRGPQPRLKLGVGGGIDPHFGAPSMRAVIAIELLGPVERADERAR